MGARQREQVEVWRRGDENKDENGNEDEDRKNTFTEKEILGERFRKCLQDLQAVEEVWRCGDAEVGIAVDPDIGMYSAVALTIN